MKNPWLWVACLGLLLLPSCGWTQRIAELEVSLQNQMAALDTKMASVEADTQIQFDKLNRQLDEGEITMEEYNRRADALEEANRAAYKSAVTQAKAEAVQAVDGTIQGIKSDMDSAKATAAGALNVTTKAASGMLGLGPLGDLAGTALATAFGLNTYRNRRRRTRGEVV